VTNELLLLFLTYISLGLRRWSRRIKRTWWQANDWVIVAATVRSRFQAIQEGVRTDTLSWVVMTKRYDNEVAVILTGGLGIHVDEVAAVGGPEALCYSK
jgi:hypothetical protein